VTSPPVDPAASTPVAADDDLWVAPTDPLDELGRTDPAHPPPSAAPSRRRPAKAKSGVRNLVEWVVVIGGAITVAVVIRAFVFQTFWIPSPSMATTLVKDDRVVVNKLSYRLHDVRRGDVVVFHRPPSETSADNTINDLIKRVVGLEGERVSILDGGVRIDGAPLEEPYTHGLETLDNGCSTGELQQLYTEEGFLVPDDHVFVLGDNRVNSGDGRCFGPVDEDLIVGRAFFKIWPPGHVGGL
jgi:signal peptidase I